MYCEEVRSCWKRIILESHPFYFGFQQHTLIYCWSTKLDFIENSILSTTVPKSTALVSNWTESAQYEIY